ncbi:MAG: hypothetical protein KAS04_04135, partial [Candidatus Aenigmarchaeota archaeon]|nr:hypothetical protein [Candidatus Aenigmarchaeota archaeon]
EVSALPKSTWAFADLLEPGAMSGPDILYGAVKGLTVSAIKPAEKRIMGMLKKVPGNRNWDGVRNSLNNGIDELTKGLLGIKEAEYDGAAARWGIGERMSHG